MDHQATGIALRLPPIAAGPHRLVGTKPLIMFAEQGGIGARVIQPAILENAALPPFQSPTSKFAIDQLVIILDRSSSMAERVTPRDPTPKLDHVQKLIASLGRDVFPEANISLIALNSTSHLVDMGPSPDIRVVKEAIASIQANGGTHFANGLQLASDILSENKDPEKFGRKVVVFVTDGQDSLKSREFASELAAKIRGQNAGVFMIGVGADYEQAHLIHLAGKFGFAGWVHTPHPSGDNTVRDLLPDFINNIQSAEHYLEIHTSAPIGRLYGLTPSVREGQDGVFFLGYQNEGVGIYFSDSDEPEITLEIKKFQGDEAPQVLQIPIVDFNDPANVATHFERFREAPVWVGRVLATLAQLDGDISALEQLRSAYPSIQEKIDELLANMQDVDCEASRLNTRAAASDLGTFSQATFSQTYRQLPIDAGGYPHGDVSHGNLTLHSGGLGPLSGSVPDEIPPLLRPDPKRYAGAIPRGAARLIVIEGTRKSEVDIPSVYTRDFIVGRSRSCDIVLENKAISRKHLSISKEGDSFYLNDLGSRNGVFLNDQPVLGRALLNNNDKIRICNIEIHFHSNYQEGPDRSNFIFYID